MAKKRADFDDAVSIDKIKSDSSAPCPYRRRGLKEDTLLDEERHQREASLYVPDRVIPMLPMQLSNGICSLNPNVDRLTLTSEMDISPTGFLGPAV